MKTILNNVEKAFLLGLSLVFVAVSVVCEVMLFTEQTTMPMDTALAALVAFGLVCFQFLFAAIASKFWQHEKKLIAVFMYVITGLLFIISLSATAGFFESRFQESQQESLQSSNGYKMKIGIIDDLVKQENALIESARKSTEKGNDWYAGQLLIEASDINKKRSRAIAELGQMEPTKTDATTSIVTLFGSARWGVWVLFAALVDLCPLVAFASYSTRKEQPEKTPETPEKQGIPQGKTHKETPKQHTSVSPTVEQIKAKIKTFPVGLIGVREVMRKAQTTNHKRTKSALEELREDGVLVYKDDKYFRL